MTNIEEIWKDVVGFEGKYQVSNLGRIKSLRKFDNNGSSLIMKQQLNCGYKCVCLTGDKLKLGYVHRLIAIAFLENPLNLPQVNHKDHNRANNKLSNLEWVSVRENTNYSTNKSKKYTNVYMNRGRWKVSFTTNGVSTDYGYFKTEEEAALLAKEVRNRLGIIDRYAKSI